LSGCSRKRCLKLRRLWPSNLCHHFEETEADQAGEGDA
jgi:hypothetical protein